MATEPPGLPGTSLDSTREPLRPQLRRSFVRSAAQAALAISYRSLNPDSSEGFTAPPDRPILERLYYQADDGWQAPLFRLPARPAATGEPVILAHGLGVNRHALDYREELSLARALQDAGFAVYLLEHRGDRSALPPSRPRPFDLDDIATKDVPAAIDAVRDHSGFAKVLYVGHAMGGQALYAWLTHGRGLDIAAATTLCSAVHFPTPKSGQRALSLARQLLPKRIRLPTRALATLLAPGAHPGQGRLASLSTAGLSGEIARGLMLHGTEDLSVALLRQVLLWLETGALCDRDDRLDYVDGLVGVTTPVQVIAAHGDALCGPEQAFGVAEALEGDTELLQLGAEWGHMDPLLSSDAPEAVYPRIVAWLDQHRRDCW